MERHKYAAYGTSHWQSPKETKAFYHQDNNGFILGDLKKETYKPLPREAFANPKVDSYSVHPFSSDLNQQYLVLGPPGSSKTTGFILPNIFHIASQGMSMVITDPKGELYQLTANELRAKGYRIVVLDYLWFKYGARQNLPSYIRSEEQLAEVANMYLNATRNEGDKADFWESKAQELFTALLGFVKQTKGAKGTFTDVYRLIPYLTDADSTMALFRGNNITGAPMELLRSVLGSAASANTMAGIIGTLSARLQLFSLSNVQAQTGATDYDLSQMTDEKTAVFVWISDSQRTYAPIISAYWTVLFNVLYEKARVSPGGKLAIPVVALIDEMANIGKIADFDIKMTTMRSRRIYPFLIWHSLPQLNLKYGEDYAKTIIASCDTKVLLACGDMTTAEFFSNYLGDTTIETQTRRGARSTAGELQNLSQQYAGRKLLQPNELITLNRKYSVVMQSGRPPVLLNKVQYQYWKDPVCEPATIDDLPSYELAADEDEPILKQVAAANETTEPSTELPTEPTESNEALPDEMDNSVSDSLEAHHSIVDELPME
ncbi:VirD4-like conjugal transfer protein, CD1115 family [Alicyclobacillus mengziensis]|uniref:Type IV secretory system conjugative DNA transfer family protein n=1 Tax=Alicyclobacillus mengziensis TaxID=2931921 RepID=A0A9X7W3S6_9BACL|nr:type IV secretory system conjugative DNA transfer family protein [Alicyclobacillus mengziensis]QSO50109.1 type IV secretory system conjugative DNA transfer family protein [Alicyclobacillus mengziensis]